MSTLTEIPSTDMAVLGSRDIAVDELGRNERFGECSKEGIDNSQFEVCRCSGNTNLNVFLHFLGLLVSLNVYFVDRVDGKKSS